MLQHSDNILFLLMEMITQHYAMLYKMCCEASHKVMPFNKPMTEFCSEAMQQQQSIAKCHCAS